MRVSNRCAAAAVVTRLPVALLLAVGCRAEPDVSRRPAAAESPPPSPASHPTTMPPTSSSLDGLYFGTSDTPDGQRAWLVRFGPAGGGSGRLYAPPDNPALVGTDVRGHPDSLILRSSPGLGGVYYVLTGHVDGDTVRGVIETVRARRPADSVVARSAVTLRPVTRTPTDTAGLYSSMALNEESGDLAGEEVVLLPAADGGWAAVVAGLDGDLTPYAASDVSASGGALRLRLRTASGAESYQATFAPGGLTFAPAGPAGVTGDAPSTLARRRDLAGLLAASNAEGTR